MVTTSQRQLVLRIATSPRNRCFVCGPGNPHGLQLRFTEEEDGVVSARFVPGAWHQGWAGVVHGGILAAVLDEAMAYTLFFQGIHGMTGRLEVRYRAAVREDDDLRVEARITRDLRRVADIEARLLRGEQVLAEATARFVKGGQLELAGMDEV